MEIKSILLQNEQLHDGDLMFRLRAKILGLLWMMVCTAQYYFVDQTHSGRH